MSPMRGTRLALSALTVALASFIGLTPAFGGPFLRGSDPLVVTSTGATFAITGEPVQSNVHIPPGHYPPAGECRLWQPNLAPGHQPPPIKCSVLGTIPEDAAVAPVTDVLGDSDLLPGDPVLLEDLVDSLANQPGADAGPSEIASGDVFAPGALQALAIPEPTVLMLIGSGVLLAARRLRVTSSPGRRSGQSV